MSLSDTQRHGLFTRDQWFTLPIRLRQQWWRETGYGQFAPSDELVREIEAFLATGISRETTEAA